MWCPVVSIKGMITWCRPCRNNPNVKFKSVILKHIRNYWNWTSDYGLWGVFCYVSVVTLCWAKDVSTGTLWCPVVPTIASFKGAHPVVFQCYHLGTNGVHMVSCGSPLNSPLTTTDHHWNTIGHHRALLVHHTTPKNTIGPPQNTTGHHWSTLRPPHKHYRKP
jgi:hypothetical protein